MALADVPGLIGRWKASDFAALAHDTPIPTWNDVSGFGRHASNPTYPAHWDATKQAVRFFRSNVTTLTAQGFPVDSTFTILIIMAAAAGGLGIVYERGPTANSAPGSYLTTTRGSTMAINGAGGRSNWDMAADWLGALGDFSLVMQRSGGTHATHELARNGSFVAGASAIIGDAGETPGVDTLNLGSRLGGIAGFNGWMKEFLVFDHPLSDDEVAQVNEYARTEYALTAIPPPVTPGIKDRTGASVRDRAGGRVLSREEFISIGFSTGAPTIGAPSITANHALAPIGLANDVPTLGTPAPAQNHAITGAGISTTAPTIGAPVISAVHGFTAVGLATTAPTVGAPSISANHDLLAYGIATDAPTLGTFVVAQDHGLTATGIEAGSATIDTPSMVMDVVLVAIGTDTAAPSLDGPLITGNADMAPLPTDAGAPAMGAPGLTQDHALTLIIGPTDQLKARPSIGVPVLTTNHGLAAIGFDAAAATIDTPTIAQVHVLITGELAAAAPDIGIPALREDNDNNGGRGRGGSMLRIGRFMGR